MAEAVSSAHFLTPKDSFKVTEEKNHVHRYRVTKPAFGLVVRRFGRFTQHPRLDRHGLFSERPQGSDPCRYYPQHPGKYTSNGTKGVWQCQQDLEDWGANLGYRNPMALRQRAWQKTLLGPAWYDPKSLAKKAANICSNVSFGRVPRFKVSKAMATCPPGTYYHEIPFKAPYGPHSKRPTFEREELCRFKDKPKSWSVAPNRYNIRDPDSIAKKPNKVVSLKGPYNLTSGPRILVQRPMCPAATWPLALPGSFETYKKSHFGTMNKTGFDVPYRGRNALVAIALSIKNPSEPGPAEQNIVKPKVFKKYLYGFNSSNDKPAGYVRAQVWPAVGRYSISSVEEREHSLIPGKGHTHVFSSKVQRTVGAVLPKPMNTF